MSEIEAQTKKPPDQAGAARLPEHAAQQEDGSLLPFYLVQRDEGLFIEPQNFQAAQQGLGKFVESLFSSGQRFSDLEYSCFQRVLFPASEMPEECAEALRLAGGVAPFLPERQALYKEPKINGDHEEAEYLFEPAVMEITEAGDGDKEEAVARSEPTQLDFDEFVAAMWLKGIRFGIVEKAVRTAISQRQVERLVVARWLAAFPGKNATVEEKAEAMHRDDSPQLLPGGKVDLSHFKNHYPQVAAGTVLMKKIPRVLGKAGRKINGELIEPDLPEDFDIATLSGTGTRIEHKQDGEYVVSAKEGFLCLDNGSSQVSITEKIVNREGVSLQTTGDLDLSGEDYEDFGDMQEKRFVKGKNMTFHGSVHGNIISRGGKVLLTSNISGGTASSPGGSISVEGRTTSSTIQAPAGGEIILGYAENSVISGSRIKVEQAVQCQIVGDHVEIGTAEGCAVAAKSLLLETCKPRKDVETIISMLVPDYAEMDKSLAGMRRKMAEAKEALETKKSQFESLRGQEEVSKFMAFQHKLAKREITMTPEQEENWNKVVARFAPVMQKLRVLNDEQKKIQEQFEGLSTECLQLAGQKQSMGEGIVCEIRSVSGETMVRQMTYKPGEDFLSGAPYQEILLKLRKPGERKDLLFNESGGELRWQYGSPANQDEASEPG